MPSVFISYSNKDRQFVERLASDLKATGLRVWYDQWELKVGDSLISKISAGIRAQDYLVVVLSRSSVTSEWVRKELSAALMRELNEKRVIVLPVLIENCEIPPLISDKVYADFIKDYASGLKTLLSAFPGYLFTSGVDIPNRRKLGSNVYLDNVITTNISDRIIKP